MHVCDNKHQVQQSVLVSYSVHQLCPMQHPSLWIKSPSHALYTSILKGAQQIVFDLSSLHEVTRHSWNARLHTGLAYSHTLHQKKYFFNCDLPQLIMKEMLFAYRQFTVLPLRHKLIPNNYTFLLTCYVHSELIRISEYQVYFILKATTNPIDYTTQMMYIDYSIPIPAWAHVQNIYRQGRVVHLHLTRGQPRPSPGPLIPSFSNIIIMRGHGDEANIGPLLLVTINIIY